MSVKLSFFTWVVGSWGSINYMHSIITAGPEACDTCSSWVDLPEKHMDSTILEVSPRRSSPGWGWGKIFFHELHTVPLNHWDKCDSLSAFRSQNTKRNDPKTLLHQLLCIWHRPESSGVQRIFRYNRKSHHDFQRHDSMPLIWNTRSNSRMLIKFDTVSSVVTV